MSGQETQSNNRPQGKKPQNNRSKQSGSSKSGSNRSGSSNQRSRNQQRSGPPRTGAKSAPAKSAPAKVAPVVVAPVKVAQAVVAPRRSPLQKLVVISLGSLGLLVGLVISLLTSLYLFAIAGGVVGGGAGVLVYRNLVGKAFDSAISLVSARPIDAQDEPRLFNLMASLCAVSGVQMPTVAKSSDTGFNACVFVDPRHKGVSHIVFTEGLLESLSRIELEGVIAACLARMKSGQLEAQTESTGILHLLGGAVPAALRTKVLRACAEAQEVFDADVKACGITRYPPGLIAAYEHFEDESTVTSASSALVAHLWLANPLGEALPQHKQASRGGGVVTTGGSGSTVEDVHVTHPALATRIALLREI